MILIQNNNPLYKILRIQPLQDQSATSTDKCWGWRYSDMLNVTQNNNPLYKILRIQPLQDQTATITDKSWGCHYASILKIKQNNNPFYKILQPLQDWMNKMVNHDIDQQGNQTMSLNIRYNYRHKTARLRCADISEWITAKSYEK